MVTNGDIAWGLSPGQLTLINPLRSIPSGYDYPASEGNILESIGWFVHGALVLPAVSKLELSLPVQRSGSWVIEARRGPDAVIELGSRTGVAADSRVFFDRAIITTMTRRPAARGGRWEAKPSVGQFPPIVMATEMTEFAPDGRIIRRLVLELAEQITEEDLRPVLSPPELDRTDAVRGTVTFAELHDHRGDTPVFTVDRDGQRQILHGDELPEVVSARRLRHAGWWAGGAALFGIGLFAWYRARRA
jgi:hypothetical protein